MCEYDTVRIQTEKTPYSAVLLRDGIPKKSFFVFLLFYKGDGSICPLSFKAFNGGGIKSRRDLLSGLGRND